MSSSATFPTVQSGAYNSYNVLALGPCHKASQIFARHTDALCWGDFTGNNTAYVNYTPLGIASMKSGAPGTSSMSGTWGTPFNNTAQSKTPMGTAYSTLAQAMMNVPVNVSPACVGNVAYDPTLAPSITRRSYGTYFNVNGASACGNMSSGTGSCLGQ